MARATVRLATSDDLNLLVRHRRLMWEAISRYSRAELDAADRVYRRWARDRMASRRFAGFIVEVDGQAVASGCVWLMDVQPRPGVQRPTAAYLLSMFTEPYARGRGHAARIVRAAIRWAKLRGSPTVLLHASRYGEPLYRRLGFERTREMRRTLGPRSRRRRGTRRTRAGGRPS